MSGLLWNEPSIDLTRIIEISLALEARQIGLISRVAGKREDNDGRMEIHHLTMVNYPATRHQS